MRESHWLAAPDPNSRTWHSTVAVGTVLILCRFSKSIASHKNVHLIDKMENIMAINRLFCKFHHSGPPATALLEKVYRTIFHHQNRRLQNRGHYVHLNNTYFYFFYKSIKETWPLKKMLIFCTDPSCHKWFPDFLLVNQNSFTAAYPINCQNKPVLPAWICT